MGNDQSRGTTSKPEDVVKPLDYYELLQIDEDATFDDIKVSPGPLSQCLQLTVKRAYRKLAVSSVMVTIAHNSLSITQTRIHIVSRRQLSSLPISSKRTR